MKKLTLFVTMTMIACLVFSMSCVSKDIEVPETYYETEYRTESYTDIVNGEDELTLETYWYCKNLTIGGRVLENIWGESLHFGGYSGVWYLEYKLPEHSTSKVVIQNWEEEKPDTTTIKENQPPTIPEDLFGPYGLSSEMVSAYDVTKIGHISKPTFDKPLYVTRTYTWPNGWQQKSVSSFEEKQINEWLDQFDAKRKSCHLDTQFDCPISEYSSACLEPPKETYEFDTTGVENLAIIIAGRGYRGKDQDFASILREPLLGGPWPIKSIRLIWVDEIPKQHQVPYQVEKQRTVTQTEKVPFWEAIFH